MKIEDSHYGNVDRAKYDTLLSVVSNFITQFSQIYNSYQNEPVANSIAMYERENYPNRTLVEDAQFRGILSIEVVSDLLMAWYKTITEPITTISICIIIRSFIENCSIALWLLDPEVDVRTRVSRYLAFRFQGLDQQKRYASALGMQAELEKVNQRIYKVENDAVALGFSKIRDKSDRIIGIAEHMPSFTKLVKDTLDMEDQYRWFSFIIHGHHFAVKTIGFREVSRTGNIISADKIIPPQLIELTKDIVFNSFIRVICSLWKLYGWDNRDIDFFSNLCTITIT
ncbi:MAG: hypothetical protein HPY85_08420 [Anaerolineae bacterium]|nr:hypothetical protein [Anaerolineae bacterium]